MTATANNVDGTYAVTAFTLGASATFSLTNTGFVSSIAVTPAETTLYLGLSAQLVATATLSDGSTANVTYIAGWLFSSPAVNLGLPGVVIGEKLGSAQITAVLGTVTSPSVTVHVVTPPPVLVVNTTGDLAAEPAGLLSLRDAVERGQRVPRRDDRVRSHRLRHAPND